jgi:hypothetical protein
VRVSELVLLSEVIRVHRFAVTTLKWLDEPRVLVSAGYDGYVKVLSWLAAFLWFPGAAFTIEMSPLAMGVVSQVSGRGGCGLCRVQGSPELVC